MRMLYAVAAVAAFGAASAAGAQAPTAAQGKKLYQTRCGACHVPADAPVQAQRLGPSLQGVVGRKAGSLAAFPRYSRAMKAHGQAWTEAHLDDYLENPRKVVPGTTMAFVGLKNPQERAAVIAYLKSAAPRR